MKLKIALITATLLTGTFMSAEVKYHNADTISKAKQRFCNYEIPKPVALVTYGSMKKPCIVPVSQFGQVTKNEMMLSVCNKDLSKGIKKNGIFAINYIEDKYLKDVEYCGLTEGLEKFNQTSFNREKGINGLPLIKESPISIECKVDKIITLNNDVIFIGKIVNVKQRKNKDIDWLLHVGDNYFTTKDINAKVLNAK